MRKMVILLILALLTTSAYAEISAKLYSGNAAMGTMEQAVYIEAYNNSGTDIAATSHYVVILDNSYTTVDRPSSAVGTYFTTTTGGGDTSVLGVTEGAILNGTVGKVIIRGPSKIDLTTALGTYAAGATISTSTTAGLGRDCILTAANAETSYVAGASVGAVIAVLIAPSGDDYPDGFKADVRESENNVWWGWVNKQ